MTFTEPVDVAGAWFDITCAISGQHNSATTAVDGQDHYITPNVNFVAGEQCTVTLFKDQVTDQDLDDAEPNTNTLPANYVWSFTVATGTEPPFPASVHLTMGNPSGADHQPRPAEQLPDGEAGVRAVVLQGLRPPELGELALVGRMGRNADASGHVPPRS